MNHLPRLLAMFPMIWSCAAPAATYFVALNGNDSNPGTKEQPFATINRGARKLQPGDTLYIRGGTYYQAGYVGYSGTEQAPLTVSGYESEQVVLDGQHTLPTSTWGSLFLVEGNHVVIRDITVKRSNWMGVVLKGYRNQAINVKSHQNMENGILLNSGASYSVVEGCEVYYNCMSNERYSRSRGDWASGLSSARGPVHVTIRNNKVWNNWGEGLSTYEAEYALIEGNVIYDNMLNVYLSDTRYSTLQNNLIYCTPGNPCARDSQIGIALADERYDPPSSDNKIINNVLWGNSKNLYYWPGVSGGGLVNVTIAHNTLVNATDETNLKFLNGNHSNTWIGNNIIVQEDSLPPITLSTATGLTFSHNLWSKSRTGSAAGQGDLITNPRLLRTGSTAAGQLKPDWFRISTDSPAVGAAQPLASVPSDFAGVSRTGSADIGAFEANPSAPSNISVHER